MNPPFVPWDRMASEEKESVKEILGSLAKYRMDLAMAFVWRAVQSLSNTAVMASVSPTPLFETDSGQGGVSMAADNDVLLVGCFEGYGFFRGSLVEPGILLLRHRTVQPRNDSPRIRVIIAKSGHEDEAIRGFVKTRETRFRRTNGTRYSCSLFDRQRPPVGCHASAGQ